jgi:hypothetical protein
MFKKMLKKLKTTTLCEEVEEHVDSQKVDFLKYVIQSDQIKKNSKENKSDSRLISVKKIKKVQTFLRLMNYY